MQSGSQYHFIGQTSLGNDGRGDPAADLQKVEIELQRVKGVIEDLSSGQNAEEIYRRLANGLHARGGGTSLYLPRFGGRSQGEDIEGGQPLSFLAVELAQLDKLDLAVTRHMVPSKVPILGKLVDFVKAQLHDLTLYYVNRLAAKQAVHNMQVNQVLELLTQEVSRLEAELARHTKQDPEEKNGQA